MFSTQRDLVVYIHHALMRPHEDTNMACAFHYGVVVYALDNEINEWIAEALGYESSHPQR